MAQRTMTMNREDDGDGEPDRINSCCGLLCQLKHKLIPLSCGDPMRCSLFSRGCVGDTRVVWQQLNESMEGLLCIWRIEGIECRLLDEIKATCRLSEATRSRIKWKLTSMCFVHECITGLIERYVTPRLSHQRVGGKDWNHINSAVVLARALYAALVLD